MAFVGTFSPDVPLTNRNLVINGAMQVAQRGTSVTGITTSDYYTADRWRIGLVSAGTWTMNVESSAPTGTEFRNSANVICTTADSSLSASDNLIFNHRIEGQNLQGIKKGTANAESLTVSFWVKSSNTGTYICELFDNDNTRQISKSYTIDAANTWEKKTITFPPDTTGQFDNDNALSLQLVLHLAAGTNFTSGTLNDTAWASSTNANRAVGQLNLANLSGNYWAITGVQLEIGETATNYEMRSFAQELQLCQRYYQKSYNQSEKPGGSVLFPSAGTHLSTYEGSIFQASTYNSTYGQMFTTNIRLKVPMRTKSTTITIINPYTGNTANIMQSGGGANYPVSSISAYSEMDPSFTATVSGNSVGNTVGDMYRYHWTVSAEL